MTNENSVFVSDNKGREVLMRQVIERAFFACLLSLLFFIPIRGMDRCVSGRVITVKKDNFIPEKCGITRNEFEYIRGLNLYGKGLNVLSCGSTAFVNNIFPVGRGSQYLKGRSCLEVCDLVAEFLGFNYRDLSEASHVIQLRGPAILAYADYVDFNRDKLKRELCEYAEAIRWYGVEYLSDDRSFIESARRWVAGLKKQRANSDDIDDLECYTNSFERLVKLLALVNEFFGAAESFSVNVEGRITDVVQATMRVNRETCLEYMKCVNDKYLSTFNGGFTPSELSSLNADSLSCAQRVSCSYAQFAHTEYELMFYMNKGISTVTDVHAISYNDLCKWCEKLWAQNSVRNVSFVSLHAYFDSRKRQRGSSTTNENLVEVHVE